MLCSCIKILCVRVTCTGRFHRNAAAAAVVVEYRFFFLPIVSGTFSAGGPRLLAVGPDQTSTAAGADAAAGVAADSTRRARRRDT